MNKIRSAFDEYAQQWMEKGVSHLESQGWLNPDTRGPIVDLIHPLIGQPEDAPPEAADSALQISYWVGTAYEYQGQITTALGWYQLGQYLWRGNKQFAHAKDEASLELREVAAMRQLPAAICADRVGNTQHARELYEWAAANYTLTSEEVDWYTSSKQYHVVWSRHPYRAYALIRLEHWNEALKIAEEARRWAQQDRGAQTTDSYQSPLKILSVVLSLAHYKVSPTDENRWAAQEALNPQTVASRSHADHIDALFHLYNLRTHYPELANPPDEELPFAERAQQADQACRQFMAQGGFHLDGTPESLKLLDQRMRNIYHLSPDQERQKMLIMLWGSYFGEVVRRQLAGGQWKFEKELLEASLEWQLGEVKLNLWAYEYVLGYLQGESEKSLFQLWQETEQAYIDYGLTAKYAD